MALPQKVPLCFLRDIAYKLQVNRMTMTKTKLKRVWYKIFERTGANTWPKFVFNDIFSKIKEKNIKNLIKSVGNMQAILALNDEFEISYISFVKVLHSLNIFICIYLIKARN